MPPLPAKGRNGYPLVGLEIPFDRRLIACSTLSVFAPTKMTAFVTRLPDPDIYADMAAGERMVVFRATLTPAQWRKVISTEGIGLEDLDAQQRPLFLAILSHPMVVHRVIGVEENPEITKDRIPESIPVSPAQRLATRISLRQRITWSFIGGRYFQRSGMRDDLPPGTAELRLATASAQSMMSSESTRVFGSPLVETVRARLKPGDLPFDWNGLDPRMTLTGAETVGDLFQRARAATRVEIYCDFRYARMPIHTRGASARTGDILKALCYAVTGTFRRVGSAFVFTDDREGLGTRHARLQDWLLNGIQAIQQIAYRAHKAMYDQPTTSLIWDESDYVSPNAALKTKLADFKKRQETLSIEEWRRLENRQLLVPINELPPAMGETIRGQLARLLKDPLTKLALSQESDRPAPIRSDVVGIDSTERFVLVVPGIGVVDASQLQETGNFAFRNYEPPSEQRDTRLVLQPGGTYREVIIAPNSVEEAQRAVREAKRRGFTALWLMVCPDDTAILSAGITAGKAAGIPVGAVVRVLRSSGTTNLPLDINILGETSPEVATRVSATTLTHSIRWDPDSGWNGVDPAVAIHQEVATLVAREKRWGGWLRANHPEARGVLRARIAALARLPGLAGLILCDLVEPGSEGGEAAYDSWNALTMLGYNPETRLAFLRKYGTDPVDLSPLHSGNLQEGSMSFPQSPNIHLPFFQDSGPPSIYDYGKADVDETEWEIVSLKWIEWRIEIARTFAATFLRDLQLAAPNLPLLSYAIKQDNSQHPVHWLSLLKAGDVGIASLLPLLAARKPAPSEVELLEGTQAEESNPRAMADAARLGVQRVVQILPYQPDGDENQVASFVAQVNMARAGGDEGWDGQAFDLTEVSVDTAFSLLDAVQFSETPKLP